MLKDTIEQVSGCSIIINTKSIPIRDTIYNVIQLVQKEQNPGIMDMVLENGITILLALLAASVALYQVKSNVVSAARIKWIEELRQEISELYDSSLSAVLYLSMYNNCDPEDLKFYHQYDQAHSKFYINANKIRMKLNIKEEDHKRLDDLISELIFMLDSDNIMEQDQVGVEIKLKEMVLISRSIFKQEWDKSKRLFKI
jgi:hypothetical protein